MLGRSLANRGMIPWQMYLLQMHFFQGKVVARDLLAGNAIFLCSQNNFTLSLNLPHSTGLYLLP